MADPANEYDALVDTLHKAVVDDPSKAAKLIKKEFDVLGFPSTITIGLICVVTKKLGRERDLIAFAVLSGLISNQSGNFNILQASKLIRESRFIAMAAGLQLNRAVARIFYRLLLRQWSSELPRRGQQTITGKYRALRGAEYHEGAEVIASNPIEIAITAGIPIQDARKIHSLAFQKSLSASVLQLVMDTKGADHMCCPPLSDIRWNDRFNFFGAGSHLGVLVETLKANIAEAIKRIYNLNFSTSRIARWNQYRLGDGSLNILGVGTAVQTLSALSSKTTLAEVIAWLDNIHAQLDVIRTKFIVAKIRSDIHTDDPTGPNGGGDGDSVDLLLVSGSGSRLMDVAPADKGFNYDDGADAVSIFDDGLPELVVLPAVKDAMNIKGIRLVYDSNNEWAFGSAQIRLMYLINPHSGPLTDGQGGGTGSWDLIHDDQESGKIEGFESFHFSLRAGSRLRTVQSDFSDLDSTLDAIKREVTEASTGNFYVVHGNAIINLLMAAAQHSLNGEPNLARLSYLQAIDILNQRGTVAPLDAELFLAVNCLISNTYLSEGNNHFAYGYLYEAWKFLLPGDDDSAAYLWLKFAELFLQWGGQLYASAGSDYESRLEAIPFLQKVADNCMHLTYGDGAEDEITGLWLDLGRSDGVIPTTGQLPGWMNSFRLHTTAMTDVLTDTGESFAIPERALPVKSFHVTGSGTPNEFLRIRFDVSDEDLQRDDLDLTMANTANQLALWLPECVRIQVRFARYNPLTTSTPTTLVGNGYDIAIFSRNLGAPSLAAQWRYWKVGLATEASVAPSLLCRPAGCIRELFQMKAQVLLEQIQSHLNFYGVHDEYAPNGRFQSLNRTAQSMAERASQFTTRYLDFLGRAESAVLDEMDATYIMELAQVNLATADLRRQQSQVALQSAMESVAAAGVAVQESKNILVSFQGSHEPGILRHLSTVNAGYPAGVSVNVGGFIGTLTGADGYEEQFRTQEMVYQENIRQLEATLESVVFQQQLAEIEVTLSELTYRAERLQHTHASDRLAFLQNRELTATYWHEMANIYKELANVQLQAAGRWAWFSERALEFETNIDVDITRMDYHLSKGGADRLLVDLDRQRSRLIEFKERYRDIPNIIEREFKFSTDFPDQFRALTSSVDAPPAERLGHGVRAIEFQTSMAAYDVKLPGRYSFARIMGVELELQTDVAGEIFTGHLENARVMSTTNPDGTVTRSQLSVSLVRVPAPVAVADPVECEPDAGLENTSPCAPPSKGDITCVFPYDKLLEFDWKFLDPRLKDILDRLQPVNPRLMASGGPGITFDGTGKSLWEQYNPAVDYNEKNSLFGTIGDRKLAAQLADIALLIRKMMPVVEAAWKPYSTLTRQEQIPDKIVSNPVSALMKRAEEAKIPLGYLLHVSRQIPAIPIELKKEKQYVEAIEKRRLKLLANLAKNDVGKQLNFKKEDIKALEELQAFGHAFSGKKFLSVLGELIGRRAKKTWKKYAVAYNTAGQRRFVSRDLSPGLAASRRNLFDSVQDYIDYQDTGLDYVLRIKRHDADSLSISTYSRRDDIVVYNPYNSEDQLGVFENTGIDSFWRLTLRALPANSLNRIPQWDKIREANFRVWYHAAYERNEGFRLAEVVETQAIRRAARKTLEVSFYNDFYDEFQTLIGDYDRGDPASSIRVFTDQALNTVNGWIPFVLDESLVPQPGQRIAAALLLFAAPEPSTFPNYVWRLRYGLTGTVFRGNAVGGLLTTLANQMSAGPPAGFGGLDPVATWYFQLSSADNVGLTLAPITDIRLIFEFEPI